MTFIQRQTVSLNIISDLNIKPAKAKNDKSISSLCIKAFISQTYNVSKWYIYRYEPEISNYTIKLKMRQ